MSALTSVSTTCSGAMHWRGDRTGGFDEPSVQPNSGAFNEQAAFKAFRVAFPGLLGRASEPTPAEMLNGMSATVEAAVLEAVKEHDGDLAQQILDEMFVFENLLDVDDRGIQALLREVQSESLIVALRGSNEALREKIFKNMSSRAAETLREELEARGPVRVSEVESEQKEVLKVVRRLVEEGVISLGGANDDEFV